jgi:hypothetical protein
MMKRPGSRRDPHAFAKTMFVLKHHVQVGSVIDCCSFRVMRWLGFHEAQTTDAPFGHAGFHLISV